MVQARPRTPIQELLRRMPYTLHVGNIPGGRAEFVSIQAAINYADAQGGDWTILIYPGTYDEGDITPSGGANITLKAMGENRVVIAPTAVPVTAVIVSGFTLNLEDLVITAPSDAAPALRVTGGTCGASRCVFNGVGVGDAIQQVAGTLSIYQCQVPTGDIDLRDAACTLTVDGCNINGTLDTADGAGAGVIMTVTVRHTNCNTQVFNLAATGACVYEFHSNNNMNTITDASLGAGVLNGHICRCHFMLAGLVVNGTTSWLVDNSEMATVSNTDATTTAVITIYGGLVLMITRAIGDIHWWIDDHTLKVIPSLTITDTVIQWAVGAAGVGAGDTVRVYPGTYEEAVVMAAGVNLVGIDKDQCVIAIAHATLITMAEGCYVANLTLDVTADATGDGIGIELNDAACTIHDLLINLTRTANNAYAIREATGNTAREIYLRNIRITTTDAATYGLRVAQANKTIHVENCYVECSYALMLTVASTIYSDHNLWNGTVGSSVTISAGTIQMTEDTILGARVNQAGGTCTYRDSRDTYHVFLGMYIQDALTAGAGGEVVIHAGTHEPPNPAAPGPALTVSANTLVRGQGFGTIIQGDGAAANITNLLLLNGNNIHIKDIKLILEAGCGTAGARPNVIYATSRTLIWLENLWIVGDTSVADDGSDDRQCGILWNTVTESKIVNCRIEDNDRHGIRLLASSSNNLISGNTCQGNTRAGINIADALYIIASDNECFGNGYHGIQLTRVSNSTISGNICSTNTLYGIILQGPALRNAITGNTIRGNIQFGLVISGASRNNITGNICADNDSGGTLYSGIYAEGADYNVFAGNECNGNGLHGIYLFRSSYCVLSGNVCYNQNTGDGINIVGDATTGSDENSLTGNVCRGNASDGIEIAGGANADRNLVVGNQLLGNTGLPLSDGGTNTTIAHNVTV